MIVSFFLHHISIYNTAKVVYVCISKFNLCFWFNTTTVTASISDQISVSISSTRFTISLYAYIYIFRRQTVANLLYATTEQLWFCTHNYFETHIAIKKYSLALLLT